MTIDGRLNEFDYPAEYPNVDCLKYWSRLELIVRFSYSTTHYNFSTWIHKGARTSQQVERDICIIVGEEVITWA